MNISSHILSYEDYLARPGIEINAIRELVINENREMTVKH